MKKDQSINLHGRGDAAVARGRDAESVHAVANRAVSRVASAVLHILKSHQSPKSHESRHARKRHGSGTHVVVSDEDTRGEHGGELLGDEGLPKRVVLQKYFGSAFEGLPADG